MKKETKRRSLCLLALAVLCLSGFFCVQIKAEDAFVVEEEVVIGGDDDQGNAQDPVQGISAPATTSGGQEMQNMSAPVSTEKMQNSKKVGSGAISKKKSEIEAVTAGADSVSANSISENSVSQNKIMKSSPPPVFRVPVRKQAEKQMHSHLEKSVRNQPAVGETEESIQREVPQSPKKNPWWLLVISAVFFIAGCTRLVWKHREKMVHCAFDNKR